VHPPYTDLRSVQTVLQADDIPIALGAQNCHAAENGAFTGEVSCPMLAKLDVSYVIVGHSERRELFGETDAVVNEKAKAVLANNMTPIVCVGETIDERNAGQAESKVAGQIAGSLEGLSAEIVGGLVVAYEPIWAIGTGETATADDAQQMCAHIRTLISDQCGADAAATVRIQYGGSVKPGNASELMGQADIDGALVGGASLDAEDFARIVNYRLYGV
jgi:triosephosphate isomerase